MTTLNFTPCVICVFLHTNDSHTGNFTAYNLQLAEVTSHTLPMKLHGLLSKGYEL
jgi:hypothetical protein